MKTLRRFLALACLVALTTSCGIKPPAPPQPEANNVTDVGYVHISMGQPMLIDQSLRDAFKPKFNLDGPAALTKSIPTSSIALRYVLDSLVASLQVAGPSKINSALNVNNGATGSNGSNTTNTTQSPGSTPTVTVNVSNTVTSTSSTTNNSTQGYSVGVPGSLTFTINDARSAVRTITSPDPFANATLGGDPVLQYLNAMSLFNAVTALDNTIERIQPPEGWNAYIVPVRVSLSPKGNNWPYDLRTTLMFAGVQFGDAGPRVVAKKNEPAARVFPLGTDNHDKMTSSSERDLARAFGLGLGWTAGLTGIGANLQKLNEATDAYLGNSYHAVSTAGQSGENMVDVRIGASRTSATQFAALERTHIMVFVVMVPANAEQIVVTGANSFIHATSGQVVDNPYDGTLTTKKIWDTLKRYQINIAQVCERTHLPSESNDIESCKQNANALVTAYNGGQTVAHALTDSLRRVQQLAQYGRLSDLGFVVGLAPDPAAAGANPAAARAGFPINSDFSLINLVTSLSHTLDHSSYSKAIVILPPVVKPKPPTLPLAPPAQTVVLVDNGTTTVGELHGGTAMGSFTNTVALLKVNGNSIAARTLAVLGDGEGLSLTFPSMKALFPDISKEGLQIDLKGVDSVSAGMATPPAPRMTGLPQSYPAIYADRDVKKVPSPAKKPAAPAKCAASAACPKAP